MRSGVTEAAEKKECRESLGAKQRYSVLHRVFVCGENHEISPETAVFQRFVIDRSGKNRYNDISLTIPEKKTYVPENTHRLLPFCNFHMLVAQKTSANFVRNAGNIVIIYKIHHRVANI